MTAEELDLRTIWPYSKEEEIILKQFHAYLWDYFGFIDVIEKDIHKKSGFVGSDASSKPFLQSAKPQSSILSPQEISPERRKRYELLGVYDEVVRQLTAGKIEDKDTHFSKKDHHHRSLVKHDPNILYNAFMGIAKNQSFEFIINRFFIARKKKLNDSLEMFAKNLEWRIKSHQADKWVFGGDADIYFQGKSPQLIDALKINQVYMHGRGKDGNPIIVVRVKEHFGKNCPERDFEKLIVIIIEWANLSVKPFQEHSTKGSIFFDMTGFSMKNCDFAAIKFLATAFEANYPECLAAIWIHNAPWIFNAAWKIIRGWLDPVVASKIHFTKGAGELEKFVDKKYIPKSLGGADTFQMKYQSPTHEDSDKRPKDERYKELVKERDDIILSYIEHTDKWIKSTSIEESDKYLALRLDLGVKMSKNYVEIDPYIRTRGLYERVGEMSPIGY